VRSGVVDAYLTLSRHQSHHGTDDAGHQQTRGVSVYSADVEFWHRLSTGVASDNTCGSRCRAAADRIRQRS